MHCGYTCDFVSREKWAFEKSTSAGYLHKFRTQDAKGDPLKGLSKNTCLALP